MGQGMGARHSHPRDGGSMLRRNLADRGAKINPLPARRRAPNSYDGS